MAKLGNRKAAEAIIMKWIPQIIPNGVNEKIYKEKLAALTDEEFHNLMLTLKAGGTLPIYTPNYNDTRINTKHLFRLAKTMGVQLFHRIQVPESETNRPYLTPRKYLVVRLPYRRAAQLLVKKISIPADNNSVDFYTGQVTGSSKGASISLPELRMLSAMNLSHSVVELEKYRGGDEGGFRAMNYTLHQQGRVSMKEISQFASGVRSTWTLKQFLNAAHLKNTLTDKA